VPSLCRASAAPGRIIGRSAQRDAEFHVAGCRCAVGCGWRGVGSCRDDRESLGELERLERQLSPSPFSGSCLPVPGTTVLLALLERGARSCVKRVSSPLDHQTCHRTYSHTASMEHDHVRQDLHRVLGV
jgi:hypothetical protein